MVGGAYITVSSARQAAHKAATERNFFKHSAGPERSGGASALFSG
jgi:hypothetical protein